MKTRLLTLAALLTSVSSFAQITLGDAYAVLADIPAMQTQSGKTAQVVRNANVRNVKNAAVSDYKGRQDLQSEFFYMVESLPMRDMLVGANNGREMTYVFAQPAGVGAYNILVLSGDTDNGNYSASYGQTDAAGVQAIRDSKVTMCQGTLALDEPGITTFDYADNE
ncbi:MAG: hypothetical protein K2O24_09335 [Muribaculaceae bacterium]|nr:hypothetical protein [Muribaculaceae bacterium]